jgi:hypothetical protein
MQSSYLALLSETLPKKQTLHSAARRAKKASMQAGKTSQ